MSAAKLSDNKPTTGTVITPTQPTQPTPTAPQPAQPQPVAPPPPCAPDVVKLVASGALSVGDLYNAWKLHREGNLNDEHIIKDHLSDTQLAALSRELEHLWIYGTDRPRPGDLVAYYVYWEPRRAALTAVTSYDPATLTVAGTMFHDGVTEQRAFSLSLDTKEPYTIRPGLILLRPIATAALCRGVVPPP